MSEEDALVKEICDAPEEDTPRLVYADYIEERADWEGQFGAASRARAELIRLQIDLHRGALCRICGNAGRFQGSNARWCELVGIDVESTGLPPDRQVRHECTCPALEKQNRVRWLLDCRYPVRCKVGGPINSDNLTGKEIWRPFSFFTAREVRFVRGFVGVVSMTCRSFMRAAEKICQEAPIENILLCDRSLNPALNPYGKVGYLYFPSDYKSAFTDPLDHYVYSSVCGIIPEVLFDLVVAFRDEDIPENYSACLKWLSWAAIHYAREMSKLPRWTPRPDRPLFKSLKPGYPLSFFDSIGVSRDYENATSEEVVAAIVRKDPEVINYKLLYRASPDEVERLDSEEPAIPF